MSDITKTEAKPMKGIKTPDDNDVPMGRGGFVNSHKGHRRYLKMVQDRQLEYVQCKKSDKMAIAWSIVRELRASNARFLKKDANGLWNDVGDSKFREKVSQALREHQPFIKAVIETNETGPVTLPTTYKTTEPPRSNPPKLTVTDVVEPWPLHTTKKTEFVPCSNLHTLMEQPPHTFEDTLPPILESANRRRAFLGTRNEVNVCQIENLPEEECVGFNLSEFSVSRGPSFPDTDSIQSRRASSGWGSLLDLLDGRRRSLDWDFLNSSNANIILPDTNSAEDEMIRLDEPLFPTMGGDALTLKRSSPNHMETNSNTDELEYSPVKRCTLSRDKSEVARKLKEVYCSLVDPVAIPFPNPEANDEDFEEEGIESLRSALEKSFPFPDFF